METRQTPVQNDDVVRILNGTGETDFAILRDIYLEAL
jgi:hypothetical protein